MNYEGEKFLLKLYRELYNEEEVKHSGTKSDDKFELVNKYMKRLEKSEKVFDGDHEGLEKYMRERYYDRYVIKEEDIPDSYYELQKRIALERGYGHVDYTPNMKHQEAMHIIEEQKRSLDKWLDYLMKENTAYPMWARYWAFQGMLKLGMYDKEKNSFTRRSKGTTAPFIDLNPEALSYAIETVVLYQNKKEIDDEELKKLVESGNFGKIYSHNLWKIANDEEKKDKTNSLEGIWVHYKDGDGPEVARALSGKGSGWCIASESTASSYLSAGTFDIYFTKDSQGEYTNPRACIRTENGSIAEVRGINQDQNMEPEMTDIVDRKLDEFYDKETYKKKVRDMNKLTEIYNKAMSDIELTRDEIFFLLEVNSKIEGFGWEEDPRIEEIKDRIIINNRDLLLELVSIDGNYLYYGSNDLKNDKEVVLTAVKQFEYSIRFAGERMQDDKEVMLEVAKRNGPCITYASERLKDDKELVLAAVKRDGYALQYVSKRLQDDKDVVLEASTNGYAFQYASDRLKNDKDVVLEVVKYGDNLYYASEELRDDREVVLAAVKNKGGNLWFAGPKTRDDKEIVLEAVKRNGERLEQASERLKDDKEVVLAAVKNGDRALCFASERFKDDKEVVLEAVKRNGLALEYASARLQDDKEVVLEAVKQDGQALKYASEELRNDKEVVLEAVKQDGQTIAYASDEYKNNREIALEAIKDSEYTFRNISVNLKNDYSFVLEATSVNPKVLQYVSDEYKNNREIVLNVIEKNPYCYCDIGDNLRGDKEIFLEAIRRSKWGHLLSYASDELRDDKEVVLEAVSLDVYAFKFASERLKNDEDIKEVVKNKRKGL